MGGGADVGWNARIKRAVNDRMVSNQPIWRLVDKIKKDSSIRDETRKAYLATLYESLSNKDIPQRFVPDAVTFDVGQSFRGGMNDLRRTKKRMRVLGLNLSPEGNPKLKDRAFAESLGVKVPLTYAHDIPFSEIQLIPNSILKPLEGQSSACVFYVDDALQLHSILTSRRYDSLGDASRESERYKHLISANSWIIEEVIIGPSGKPANDLKVYAFYGVPGMYLEISRNSRKVPLYAAYDEAGNRMRLGPRDKEFSGSGLPTGVQEVSHRLSVASPVPFLRLDFHLGRDDLYLGEITPHPGGVHAGALYDKVDQALGAHLDEAKARLYIDLIGGKTYPEYFSAYGAD